MILCVVDDLIFSIKLKTAAKHLGAELYFERSKENVVPAIREKRPSLVILDLNSKALAPLEAVAAMKADPELRDVRTLGYVSHVDSGTIAAARQVGVGEVMARSAFVERLGTILAEG